VGQIVRKNIDENVGQIVRKDRWKCWTNSKKR
jgi:hypothetical protein